MKENKFKVFNEYRIYLGYGLFILLLFSYVFDFGVSYAVFKTDSLYFTTNEANKELINFLITGGIPYLNIISNIGALVLFPLILIRFKVKNKGDFYLDWSIFSFGAYMASRHIYGGLSWLL